MHDDKGSESLFKGSESLFKGSESPHLHINPTHSVGYKPMPSP